MPASAKLQPLGTSEKKQRQRMILLQKDKKMETADPQNSTFANRTSRHETKVCKRAVFLPTHPWIIVYLWVIINI